MSNACRVIFLPGLRFEINSVVAGDLTMWCYVLGAALTVVVIIYALLELHYFLRMCVCVILARYCKKRCHILDTTEVTGVCITTDVDTLLYHMNNARYLRELDFARVDFYERTGLYRAIRAKEGAVVQGAATIRYRRFVRPFSMFKITSKIVYWDEQSIFMEHRFITPSDQFVRAIALCRQRVIACNADDVLQMLLDNPEGPRSNPDAEAPPPDKAKPIIPLEVARWVESNDISSANLRNGC